MSYASWFLDNSIVHFRTLYPFPDPATPLENMAHSEFKRVMFRSGFTGVTVNATVAANVDFTEHIGTGSKHFTAADDSTSDASAARDLVRRAAPLIATTPALTTLANGLSPTWTFPSAAGDETTFSYDTGGSPIPDDVIQLCTTLEIIQPPVFFRHNRAPALAFCAVLRSEAPIGSDIGGPGGGGFAQLAIYAPISGANPEDFYGFEAIPSASGFNSYGAIAEADAGTLFGITLKSKGWTHAVNREYVQSYDEEENPYEWSEGIETYTPSLTVAEL